MKRAISMIMVLVLALSMCVVGASAVESDAISETSATVGNERASWGYVKIRYDPNGAWGEGSINTYAGTAYYMYVKVYATYSNGDADGPSDTASGYNKESVVTDKIYEWPLPPVFCIRKDKRYILFWISVWQRGLPAV